MGKCVGWWGRMRAIIRFSIRIRISGIRFSAVCRCVGGGAVATVLRRDVCAEAVVLLCSLKSARFLKLVDAASRYGKSYSVVVVVVSWRRGAAA